MSLLIASHALVNHEIMIAGETAIVLINPYGVQLVDSTIDIGLKGEFIYCVSTPIHTSHHHRRQRATTR